MPCGRSWNKILENKTTLETRRNYQNLKISIILSKTTTMLLNVLDLRLMIWPLWFTYIKHMCVQLNKCLLFKHTCIKYKIMTRSHLFYWEKKMKYFHNICEMIFNYNHSYLELPVYKVHHPKVNSHHHLPKLHLE